ncbi:hypothetical protein [Sediminibacterium ginsengisoli]|uniref:PRTRC system protein B n=1 Tax=Sediminibacterium ginsengisoli TaxID=413434 RepID=A0A1T4P1W6_9BACT|nr:hypothetical protein [Sediminibacterium ginsengisoli]SJZ85402.1 PRTRC system protein B [Sediminibacterium ginsengisoli]
MKNNTDHFTSFHEPQKALIIYRSTMENPNYYVEAFDFNTNGKMIDPHPLTDKECIHLSAALQSSSALSNNFLQCRGLIPSKLLYTRQGSEGFAIWHTPAMKHFLAYTNELGLTNGNYQLPAMIWRASRTELAVFAMAEKDIPTMNTPLYHAPFFNIHENGNVCMGTVDIDIDNNTYLEDFISQWEEYFFNSKFSHVLGNRSPVKGNIIQLWKSLKDARKRFPSSTLIKHKATLKNLIK